MNSMRFIRFLGEILWNFSIGMNFQRERGLLFGTEKVTILFTKIFYLMV